MEALQVLREQLNAGELLKGLGIAYLFAHFLVASYASYSPSTQSSWPRTVAIATIGFSLIFVFARSWLALVNHYSPEPYLVCQLTTFNSSARFTNTHPYLGRGVSYSSSTNLL